MTGQRLFILRSLILFAGCAETSMAPSSGKGMSDHSSPSQMTAQSAPTRRSVSLDGVTLSILGVGTGDQVSYVQAW